MLNDNVYISPALVLSLIVGLFAMVIAAPLGFLMILVGVNAQRARLKKVRRARRGHRLTTQQRALDEQHRAWAALPG